MSIDRDLKTRADAQLAAAVREGAAPGVAAFAVSGEGVVYEGAAGVRSLGADAPMDADTVCWIASMSKPITSVAAVQLAERGVIDLDAPASAIAPELAEAMVLTGFDAAGGPLLRAPKRPVTLRHLLTHTSGFGYELFSADVVRAHAALGIPSIGEGKLATLRAPLLFDPGERWEYGIGVDWAGRLVELASGRKLGAYLKENLFEPLGMTSTGFEITPAMQERMAGVHVRTPDGALAPFPFGATQGGEFESGGGGLYSTARDYARFVRAILGGGALDGARVLGEASVAELARNQIGPLRTTPLKSVTPLALDSEMFPGVPKSWSLAFAINEASGPTGRPAGGLMWSGLSNCFFWIDPKTRVGGVVLTQVLPYADPGALGLWLDFETAVYASR